MNISGSATWYYHFYYTYCEHFASSLTSATDALIIINILKYSLCAMYFFAGPLPQFPKRNPLPQLVKKEETHLAPGGRDLISVESSVRPGESAKPLANRGRSGMPFPRKEHYEEDDSDFGPTALPRRDSESRREQKLVPEPARVKPGEEWSAVKLQPVRSQPWVIQWHKPVQEKCIV